MLAGDEVDHQIWRQAGFFGVLGFQTGGTDQIFEMLFDEPEVRFSDLGPLQLTDFAAVPFDHRLLEGPDSHPERPRPFLDHGRRGDAGELGLKDDGIEIFDQLIDGRRRFGFRRPKRIRDQGEGQENRGNNDRYRSGDGAGAVAGIPAGRKLR